MSSEIINRDALSEVTVVIKTFERPKALNRVIRSVRRFYPQLKIVVADDSRKPRCPKGVTHLRLPPDSGVGAGRNALLYSVSTRFFLTLDDDYQLTKHSNIEQLLKLVADGVVSLAGGDCIRVKRKLFYVKERPQPYYGTIRLEAGHLQLAHGYHSREDGFFRCDIIPQFFVAHTETIQGMGGWDSELKTNDHQEFFVRLKQNGIRVGYCPSVSCLHWHTMPAGYAAYRRRDHRAIAARKMGVTRWTKMDGETLLFGDEQPEQLRRAS